MERKIALCVSQWSADSTLYAWSYAKQYFLRKQRDASGAEVLSSLDKLYIVHVWKDGKKEKEKDKDKWCGGGPLLPSMRVALAKFPHQIVDLEKLVQPGGMGASTSDTVKSKSKCPCLIVRPASARNEKMRIKSNANLGTLLDAEARGRHMDGALAARLKTTSMVLPGTDELRKVCLAFESVEVGQHMLAWATKYCLFPDDEVYIVHCLSKSLMKLANKRGNEVGPEVVEEVDGDAVNVVSNTQLKDEPKSGLCDFLEENSIDLVIVGYVSTSRLRKTLNLGQASLSSHLLHHAPCPTLVIPFKSLSSEGSVPEALPAPAAIGEHVAAAETSPRDAGPDASPAARPSSAGGDRPRRPSIGSPGASGTYPLAIVSDEETEAGSAGRPTRAHSLRNALQSWRSIRTALGDRHSAHASAFAAAAGTSGDADDDGNAPAQNGGRRGSRGALPPPETDSGAAAQYKRRIEEQEHEIATLREKVQELGEALARAKVGQYGSET
ncbi:hypothetical protein COCSUDRAFT_64320 [Coccomyxa subellipsoidea C-169]|uniref:UspA domain-containing protein n=1 Tax=Coccomyxa subellipsoidea (strain C-169) TaxID=574566 RepID=I0ZAH4_COCSC|nr:hypothetical protein COCSUDRAFT_64320 [Coccomyxa subellipsoidea C-169]EIE27643.1 hypothetical protein COCSUDRAFT_64320 [Coccomyxa subellipsoidea C-169]|eukprot:XP_005652187.1 hypothetical protein COCSUDRAFT_64320 [Coccomyxa subellipsoidea C-169]